MSPKYLNVGIGVLLSLLVVQLYAITLGVIQMGTDRNRDMYVCAIQNPDQPHYNEVTMKCEAKR